MRIWSIHPKYLDAKGMVALWRETLLAQNVLLGKTRGYKNHPQLIRFKEHENPIMAIGFYLTHIYNEAKKRGYNFDKAKIIKSAKEISKIKVASLQVEYEFSHLKNKLRIRSEKDFLRVKDIQKIKTHPLFIKTKGEIAEWEKI